MLRSFMLSVLLHATIIGAATWTWFRGTAPQIAVASGGGAAADGGAMFLPGTETTALRSAALPRVAMALHENAAVEVVDFNAPGELPAWHELPKVTTESTDPIADSTSSVGSVPAVRWRGGGGGEDASASIGAPTASSRNRPPRYPAEARRKRLEGTVMLKVEVAADGKADRVTITSTSGHDLLDRAAVEAVERWTFAPARDFRGRTIGSSVNLPVRFVLRE